MPLKCPKCHRQYDLKKKLLSEEKLKAIESFMPEATRFANSATMHIANTEIKNNKWNKIFHREMDRMTKDEGLRV